MADDNNDSKAELDKFKKELKRKKKLEVPEEFLDNAKSYDDKLILVKVLTEKEKQRVVLMVKNMLRDAVSKRDKK